MVAINSDIQGYSEAEQLLREGIEIICGGFPCQDISVGGKRAGITGSRSSLWWEMLRTVRLVRPLYVIVENVAALLKRGMGTVLGDLAKVGYDTEWHCIPASSVGALHSRDRIWIIGHTHSSNANRKRRPFFSHDDFKIRPTSKNNEEWRNLFNELVARGITSRFSSHSRALRILDGIPNRAHRMKALGNSLFPKIVEKIGANLCHQ